MKVRSFETCLDTYNSFGGWDQTDTDDRTKTLMVYKYSVVVEGNYPEEEMAVKFCEEKIGESDKKWKRLWYGKISYDHGYFEFFFKSKEQQNLFRNEVDNFYLKGPSGNWKSDGWEKQIKLD